MVANRIQIRSKSPKMLSQAAIGPILIRLCWRPPISLILMAFAQAAAPLPAIDFDLAKAVAAKPVCGAAGASGDIMVCARRHDDRLPSLDATPADIVPKADIGLFGQVRGKVQADQGNVGGFSSKKAKVTVTIPF